jgi:DNA-binding transcriptional regulator YdaS (Cro superfamily)
MQENEIENDRFKTWVYDFGGTEKLSKALVVHQNSVQNWIARRARPSLDAVLGILRLSKGELSLKDIDDGTKVK